MRSNHVFNRLWLRLQKAHGRFIRPIGVQKMFYFTAKPALRQNFCVFFGIALEFREETFCIGVPIVIYAFSVRPKLIK